MNASAFRLMRSRLAVEFDGNPIPFLRRLSDGAEGTCTISSGANWGRAGGRPPRLTVDDHGLVWLSVGDIPIEIAGAMRGNEFEPHIATLYMVASALGVTSCVDDARVIWYPERTTRLHPITRSWQERQDECRTP